MTRVQELEGLIAGEKKKLETLKQKVSSENRARTEDEKNEWNGYKSNIEDLEDQLKEAKEDFEKAAKKAKEEGKNLLSGQNKEVAKKEKSFEEQIDSNLKNLQDSVSLPMSEKNEVKFHVNTRADVTASSVTNNTDAQRLSEIGQMGHRKLALYDLFTKIPVSPDANGTVRYTDWTEGSVTRAAAAIAEGAAFPESTAAWTEYTLSLKKIGDTIPVSEETLYDRARFAAELDLFLRSNVDLKVDQDLWNADGTGNNIIGLYERANTFTAAASGITDASLYDLCVKVHSDIVSSKGSKYAPNVVIMNRVDIDEMKLKKDANNNYVMPPFVSENGQLVDGLLVIESNAVTANTMVIGDSRFGRIYEEPGIFVATGLTNDDFTKDLVTMKARRRLNLLVRNADQSGWRKVTSISAALTTLAT